jgi:ATP-binding cassette subfamily B protein
VAAGGLYAELYRTQFAVGDSPAMPYAEETEQVIVQVPHPIEP